MIVKFLVKMSQSKKFLIFLCSGAAKAGNKKLSSRIASQLETMGVADIGDVKNLSEQHDASGKDQKNMIFINDCRSGCVNVLTQGFQKEKYLYFDISSFKGLDEFDIKKYIHSKILPAMSDKWDYSMPMENDPVYNTNLF
jgi:uncharacterized metal-binding protein